MTGLLLTCSYKGEEFVRVGYYVNIEYTDPEVDPEHPPNPPRIDQLQRSIVAGGFAAGATRSTPASPGQGAHWTAGASALCT